MTAETTPLQVRAPYVSPAFWARVVWIALRLALVYYCGEQGSKFFYQGF
jgi:hypothetical protein